MFGGKLDKLIADSTGKNRCLRFSTEIVQNLVKLITVLVWLKQEGLAQAGHRGQWERAEPSGAQPPLTDTRPWAPVWATESHC